MFQFSFQKSRNTYLNRSTASSRARRTPGQASPSVGSRTRAALFSATTFNPSLPRTNLTPSRHGNLSTEVQSFIKRNTPQKTMTYKVRNTGEFFMDGIYLLIVFYVGAAICKGRTTQREGGKRERSTKEKGGGKEKRSFRTQKVNDPLFR